jgi:hypothetical protein
MTHAKPGGLARLVAASVVVAVLLCSGPAAGADDEDHEGHNPIVIVGAVLTNIPYIPVKLAYSVLGGVTGVLAYLVTVGDSETTMEIWRTTCLGTYAVTPAMLEGEEPLRFSGP